MDHLSTVQAIYKAFGEGNIAGILEHLADDVAWDQDGPGYGVPILEPGSGKAHVERFFAALQRIAITRFDVTNLLAGGQQVGGVIDIEASVKATGKAFRMIEIHLWTFGADGKVSRFFHCCDRHALVQAFAP